MIFLPLLCFFYLLSLLYKHLHSRSQAVFQSTILLTAGAVLIAELTSLFTAYEIITVSLVWGLLLIGLAAWQYKRWGKLLPTVGWILSPMRDVSKKERVLLVLMLGTVLFALLKMFWQAPTLPSDATVYHQPRAFMYYKNHSIHNYAAPSGHMLYFGPLNAILISQMQILSFGWDRFSPLAQFSAYLLAILGVYDAAKLLCKSRTYGLIGAALTCFMPMAHLQATTMQSDLLTAGYCVAALCMMIRIYFDLQQGCPLSKGKLALLGLSCGLAVLGKLSAGPTLIGCALLFALLLLLKYRKKFLQSVLIILCCAVLMTGGFWVRNALDWNGDFLPISYSGARPHYDEMGAKNIALLSVKALATPFSDPTKGAIAPFGLCSSTVLWIANTAADLLGLDMREPLTEEGGVIFDGLVSPTPDHVSYPLHGLLMLIVLPAALIYGIIKKKWWLVGYGLCCLQALLITSTQYSWCTSYNRYLMPSYLISMPLCTYMLQRLTGKGRIGKGAVMLMLGAMFCMNAMCSAYFPYKDLKDIFVEKHTPEERVLSEHRYYPLTLWKQVLGDVEENGYTKIALTGISRGDYIWMRLFAAERYEVRYINAKFHSELEPEDFDPDCIILGVNVGNEQDCFEYHGRLYVRKFDISYGFAITSDVPFRFAYYVKAE